MSSVFVLIWTKYVDDYKLRGQSPSTTTVKVFNDKSVASQYALEKEEEYIKDCEVHFVDKEEESRYYDEDDGSLNPWMYDNMKKICFKGEFVPKSLEWKIEEMDIICSIKKNKIN